VRVSVTGDPIACNEGLKSRTQREWLLAQRVTIFSVEENMALTAIQENLQRIQEQIAAAANRAKRNTEEITLIGVSKTQSAAAIRQAFEAGLRHFGENRVQEWEGKRGEVADLAATWHLIGHLQSNKAAKAAKLFHHVDAVDDLALAQRLDRACGEFTDGRRLRVLVEVHLGEEASKSGVSEADLPALAEKILTLARLDFAGLMCIPPYLENPEEVRPYFARLRELRDRLEARLGRKFPVLSMGMSHDFQVAILEAATEVRVGTALFGARTPVR
jgi:PLP dependent protein